MKKIYVALVLICISYKGVLADVYLVSSNYATGAGSLSEAITLANAHLGRDTIYFNFQSSSVAGRTITLSNDSLLPNVTDEILIDGKSQPYGELFGVSAAKIQLTSLDNASVGLVLDVDAKDSEIYGLFISHFSTGVRLLAKGFQLGSVNHGNVVSYCDAICIKVAEVTEGYIVANFIGTDTSSLDVTSPNAIGILIDQAKKVTIGGKQENSRNIISGNNVGIKMTGTADFDCKFITIQGNYIGTDFSGTLSVPNTTGILASSDFVNNITIGGDSSKFLNLISGNLQRGLDLYLASSVIQGNLIGTDTGGTVPLSNGSYGIYFRDGAHDNIVGGLNPGEGNIIAYNAQEGVYLENPNVKNIYVRGNRMFCNSQILGNGGIKTNGGNQEIYPPTIVIVSGNFVTGTTYPQAEVDIYAADSCSTCEGADYLGSSIANPNGIFSVSLPLVVKGQVTVTANDPYGNTSEFSECKDSTSTSCIFASFFIYDDKVCTNENVYINDQTVTKPNTIITQWSWDFGDGQTSTDQNPTVSFPVGGLDTITLIVTNDLGCQDTTFRVVTVEDGSIADFSADINVCDGNPVHFVDESYGQGSSYISSWSWDLGDGDSSLFTDFLYIYPDPGIYDVTLTVVNNNNCPASVTQTIYVHDYPHAAFFVASPITCALMPVQFIDTSLAAPGGINVSWQWYFGDGGSSTDENAVHVFNTGGEYEVMMIVTDNFGCSDTVAHTVNIALGTVAGFTYTTSGLTANFTNTSIFNANFSLTWNFGDGTTSTLLQPSHTYNAYGMYEVCLIVNDFTCDVSDTICQNVLVVGIEDVQNELSAIRISPNPAAESIILDNLPVTPFEMQLFNSLGEKIFISSSENLSNNRLQIYFPDVSSGIHSLFIKSANAVTVKKIMISQ